MPKDVMMIAGQCSTRRATLPMMQTGQSGTAGKNKRQVGSRLSYDYKE